jgi:predicted transcriptional regulator
VRDSMEGEGRRYKSWELYSCLALNRLAEELNIDIYQDNIAEVLDRIFEDGAPSIPKVEISFEIKSNHQMTNKVLKKLESDKLVAIKKDERRYNISITKEGIMYLRRFNAYFVVTYNDIIQDHYRYRQLPSWFEID